MYAEKASLGFAKDAYEAQPVYKSGGELRPYQWESVQWMCFNWSMGQGSILADEMGLGTFGHCVVVVCHWEGMHFLP